MSGFICVELYHPGSCAGIFLILTWYCMWSHISVCNPLMPFWYNGADWTFITVAEACNICHFMVAIQRFIEVILKRNCCVLAVGMSNMLGVQMCVVWVDVCSVCPFHWTCWKIFSRLSDNLVYILKYNFLYGCFPLPLVVRYKVKLSL
jgi:hypothetical protein